MTCLHPTGPVPKNKPHRNRKYLDWLREQPCIVTGRMGHPEVETVDPAHFRWGTNGGTSMKPSDYFANPLIHSQHVLQGNIGEEEFWFKVIDKDPSILRDFIKDALKWRYFEQTGEIPK